NRFALYTKIHHSLIDGISGVRLLQRVLSTNPGARNMPPPWTVRPERVKLLRGAPADPAHGLEAAVDAPRQQMKTVPKLAGALARVMRQDPDSPLVGPFAGPNSVINRRVTPQRRFATQQYSL